VKFLLIIMAVLGMSIAETSEAHATKQIGAPPLECSQGNGLYRVWDHLVFILEDCDSFAEDISPPDYLVLFMNPRPYAIDMITECETQGGRYEYVWFIHLCWGIDY
jgi:hypothetical protein